MLMAVGGSREVHQRAAGSGRKTPDAEAVLEQLERILASGDFDASPRSRAFIRFILDETLAGRQEGLTQGAIATRVFGRRGDFDPTVDPIVRIQAGRLRRSLERYYLLSGGGDPVRIELPRGTYAPVVRWRAEGERSTRERGAGQGSLDPDGWPSVVVRLFEIDGPGSELEGAASRLNEQLCMEMGRYGDVRVVRRRELDQLGRAPCEHGDFDLSGHISYVNELPRITARLLDCRNASQVWAEDYRGDSLPASPFYEETARAIAARVASEHGVVARLLWAEHRHRPVAELLPYGAILRSYQFLFNREPAEFAPAREALQRVVRERPECGLAWVQLARLYIANYGFEIAPIETRIDEAVAFAQKAVHLDPSSQRARAALAGALLLKGEVGAGRVEAEKAYDLNPDSFVYLEWIGWLLALLGDWGRGTALVRSSMARNPNHIPVAVFALWADHLRRGEFEEAYRVALLYGDATFFWRALMRACCLGHLGRLAEAKREAAELLQTKPDFASRGRTLIGRYIKFPDLLECIVDGLGKAGLAVD
jgi:adenylate cyclase